MALPPHAKKVFEGIAMDVYHWPQKNFNKTISTFEAVMRTSGVQIIATKGDKVIISREQQPNRKPFLSPLGGLVDGGESALEAAKRELLEESGLASDDWELFSVHESEGRILIKTTNFIARNCKKISEPHLDASEKIKVLEVSFDGFFEKVLDERFRNKLLALDLVKILLDEKKKEEFRKRLFPQ